MITKEQALNTSGSELDEMVALAQKYQKGFSQGLNQDVWLTREGDWIANYSPTTNGTQCMEIMQREGVEVKPKVINWFAKIDNEDVFSLATGDTAMIAICRCFVLSKLEVINGN